MRKRRRTKLQKIIPMVLMISRTWSNSLLLNSEEVVDVVEEVVVAEVAVVDMEVSISRE